MAVFIQVAYKTKNLEGVYQLIKPVLTYGKTVKVLPRIGEYVFLAGKIWEVSVVTHSISFIEICLDTPKQVGENSTFPST